MALGTQVVGGLGNATDEDVTEGVTYTSDNGIKRTGTAQQIVVDETLTQYGQAADAGVVGVKIGELEGRKVSINQGAENAGKALEINPDGNITPTVKPTKLSEFENDLYGECLEPIFSITNDDYEPTGIMPNPSPVGYFAYIPVDAFDYANTSDDINIKAIYDGTERNVEILNFTKSINENQTANISFRINLDGGKAETPNEFSIYVRNGYPQVGSDKAVIASFELYPNTPFEITFYRKAIKKISKNDIECFSENYEDLKNVPGGNVSEELFSCTFYDADLSFSEGYAKIPENCVIQENANYLYNVIEEMISRNNVIINDGEVIPDIFLHSTKIYCRDVIKEYSVNNGAIGVDGACFVVKAPSYQPLFKIGKVSSFFEIYVHQSIINEFKDKYGSIPESYTISTKLNYNKSFNDIYQASKSNYVHGGSLMKENCEDVFLFGKDLKTFFDTFVIGQFNSPSTIEYPKLFVIGNGTGNDNRSNVVTVDSNKINLNADVYINNVIIDITRIRSTFGKSYNNVGIVDSDGELTFSTDSIYFYKTANNTVDTIKIYNGYHAFDRINIILKNDSRYANTIIETSNILNDISEFSFSNVSQNDFINISGVWLKNDIGTISGWLLDIKTYQANI